MLSIENGLGDENNYRVRFSFALILDGLLPIVPNPILLPFLLSPVSPANPPKLTPLATLFCPSNFSSRSAPPLFGLVLLFLPNYPILSLNLKQQ